MTRAVLYARVSGNDRAKTGGENIADQLRLCHGYATEHGYTIVAELQEDDRGASGATFDLPGLAEAANMARGGQFDVLVVRELDRLSRDLAKQLIVEQELRGAGVSIEYVLYDFPDTPEGRLNKNLRAMLAEYEREKIRERMLRGRERKARNGEAMTHGFAPYGYRHVKQDGRAALEVDETQAPIVRRIFRWYTEGDGTRGPMGAPAIADRLTADGVPTWADLNDAGWMRTVRASGVWCRSVVHKMLKNETYAGTFRYGGAKIPVKVPAIIPTELYEAAQHQGRKNFQHAKRNTKHEYLMQYRLRCSVCGRNLRTRTHYTPVGTARGYYYCQTHDDKSISCSNPHLYRAERLDAVAWEWLRGLLTNPADLEQSLRQYQEERDTLLAPVNDELAIIDGMTRDIRAKRKRLLDIYLEGAFEREELDQRKEQYDTELRKLYERQAFLEAQKAEHGFDEGRLQSILEFARAIGAGIEIADQDFERRRELIELLEVTGWPSFGNGEESLTVQWVLGEGRLSIVDPGTRTGVHNQHAHLPLMLSARLIVHPRHNSPASEAPYMALDGPRMAPRRFTDIRLSV